MRVLICGYKMCECACETWMFNCFNGFTWRREKGHLLPISLPAVLVFTFTVFCGAKSLLSHGSGLNVGLNRSWCVLSLFSVKKECLFSPPILNNICIIIYTVCLGPRSSLFVQRWVAQWKHSVLSQIPSMAPLHLSPTSALSLLLPPPLLLRSRSAQLRCEILSDTLRSLVSVEIKPASLSETERLTLSGHSGWCEAVTK